MKKLILVAGPAGIGKSRYCRTYAQTHPQENVQILSSDEIRKAMTHSYRLFSARSERGQGSDASLRKDG
jgi:predicted ABC-type ATPase